MRLAALFFYRFSFRLQELVKIIDIRKSTRPIQSSIRNAYIDFSKMNLSLVAVVTDVICDGKPVLGYSFNSNGRYGQGRALKAFSERCSAS